MKRKPLKTRVNTNTLPGETREQKEARMREEMLAELREFETLDNSTWTLEQIFKIKNIFKEVPNIGEQYYVRFQLRLYGYTIEPNGNVHAPFKESRYAEELNERFLH